MGTCSGSSVPVLYTQFITSAVICRTVMGDKVSTERSWLAVNYLLVDFNPLIFMNPIGLVEFRPGGIASCLGIPTSFVK